VGRRPLRRGARRAAARLNSAVCSAPASSCPMRSTERRSLPYGDEEVGPIDAMTTHRTAGLGHAVDVPMSNNRASARSVGGIGEHTLLPQSNDRASARSVRGTGEHTLLPLSNDRASARSVGGTGEHTLLPPSRGFMFDDSVIAAGHPSQVSGMALEAWNATFARLIASSGAVLADPPPLRAWESDDALVQPSVRRYLGRLTRNAGSAAEAPARIGARSRLILDVEADPLLAVGDVGSPRCTTPRLHALERFFGVRCPPRPSSYSEWRKLHVYPRAMCLLRYGGRTPVSCAPPADAQGPMPENRFPSPAALAAAHLEIGKSLRSSKRVLLPASHPSPPVKRSGMTIIPKDRPHAFRTLTDMSIRRSGRRMGVNQVVDYALVSPVFLDDLRVVMDSISQLLDSNPGMDPLGFVYDFDDFFRRIP